MSEVDILKIGNAYLMDLGEHMEVARVPTAEALRNERLLELYPELEDLLNFVYLPSHYTKSPEKEVLLRDGGRSGININQQFLLDVSFMGLEGNQTFLENRKGVGAPPKWGGAGELNGRIIPREITDPSFYHIEDYVVFGLYFNGRPIGGQCKDYALHEVRMGEELIERGVPHCPVVGAVKIDLDSSDMFKVLENRFIELVDRLLKERINSYLDSLQGYASICEEDIKEHQEELRQLEMLEKERGLSEYEEGLREVVITQINKKRMDLMEIQKEIQKLERGEHPAWERYREEIKEWKEGLWFDDIYQVVRVVPGNVRGGYELGFEDYSLVALDCIRKLTSRLGEKEKGEFRRNVLGYAKLFIELVSRHGIALNTVDLTKDSVYAFSLKQKLFIDLEGLGKRDIDWLKSNSTAIFCYPLGNSLDNPCSNLEHELKALGSKNPREEVLDMLEETPYVRNVTISTRVGGPDLIEAELMLPNGEWVKVLAPSYYKSR